MSKFTVRCSDDVALARTNFSDVNVLNLGAAHTISSAFYLACCVNHRDTPVPTEDTTSLQPSSSRLQVANLCEDERDHTFHLFVFKHVGLDVFLLARTNALLSMRNLPERHKHFSVAR